MTILLLTNLFCDIWGTVVVIFWIIVALIAYAFREQLIQIAVFIGVFMGIGALLFWWIFDNAALGAWIGFGFAVFIGIRTILESLGTEYDTTFKYAYYLISLPFWLLNRIQLILTGPWRYLFKYISIGEESRNILRPLFYVIQILLYIATTPLRLLNAILYNIFIYGITELYDLFYEVLVPSNIDEGYGQGVLEWLYMLPWRILKYPLFHGSLVIIESIIWTFIDIFIPTITMYHGTNLNAAISIVGSSKRNISLWNNWLAGTFKASDSANGWGGLGVYFSPSRRIVTMYSARAGGEPVFIACRVSFGKILNYSLAPRYLESNTGGSGRHSVLNSYADKNGYTTAEWWNGSYWEYCMFDWQNRYNHPWRIRPIYVFNIRTGRAQHIDGGMRHWFFDPTIFNDITDNIVNNYKRFLLIIIAIPLLSLGYRWLSSPSHKVQLYNSIQETTIPEESTEENTEESAPEPTSQKPIYPKPSYDPNAVRRPVYQNMYQNMYQAPQRPTSHTTSKKRKKQQSVQRTTTPASNSQSTGFHLQKVDRIPTSGNSSTNGQGFHYERVDHVP